MKKDFHKKIAALRKEIVAAICGLLGKHPCILCAGRSGRLLRRLASFRRSFFQFGVPSLRDKYGLYSYAAWWRFLSSHP